MSDAVNPWSDFYAALSEKGGFELVGETAKERQLRITGRVPQRRMAEWLNVLDILLVPIDGCSSALDVSKQYFIRKDGRRYAWRIIVQGEDVVKDAPVLTAAVHSAVHQSSSQQGPQMVMEMPLVGVGPDRNNTDKAKGKGAQGSLKSVVGGERKRKMFPNG